MRRRWAFPLVLFGLAVLGCGKGDELPPLYPAKGKVVRSGRPVPGGQVQFQSVKDQGVIFINAEVGNDGRFSLTTRKGSLAAPGAPEGSYRAVYIPPGVGGPIDEKDPARAQSALPVTLAPTFRVEAKENEFTLDLARAKK